MANVELNIIPFYAEALSHSLIIRNRIDRLYSLHKEDYYSVAKESEFYDSLIGRENSLITEEYYKKCLGLIEYARKNNDEETLNGIFDLFKRAYHKTYLYFKDKDSSENIDMNDYILYMGKYFKNLDNDNLNGNIVAVLYFSGGKCKNFEKYAEIMTLRWEHYNGYRRITLDNLSPQIEKSLSELYKTIPSDFLNEFLIGNKSSGFDFIYDLEEVSSISVFRELKLDKKDIKEIILSYIVADDYKEIGDGNKIKFEDYFLPALHVKAMCKAYKEVKKMYFDNNKETMYVEMGVLRKDLFKARSDLQLQEIKYDRFVQHENEKYSSLMEENIQLQRDIKALKEQINQLQSDAKEVIALRNYMFNQESEAVTDTEKVNLEEMNSVKGIIIGGHSNWQNKIKEYLPSWKIVRAGVNNLDADIILNCETVIFNAGHLNHSLYYKVIDMVRNNNVHIGYVSSTNVECSLKEISEICNNKKE